MRGVRLLPPQPGLQGDVQHRGRQHALADRPGAQPPPPGAGQVLLGLRHLPEDGGAALASQAPLLLPPGPAGHQLVLQAGQHLEVAGQEEGPGQEPAEEGQLRLHDLQWGQQQHSRPCHSAQGVLGGEVQLMSTCDTVMYLLLYCTYYCTY